MRINLAVIAENLPEGLVNTGCYDKEEHANLKGVLLWHPESSLRKDYVYLVFSKDWLEHEQQLSECHSIVYGQTEHCTNQHSLFLNESISFHEVFTLVQDIFQKYNDFESELLTALSEENNELVGQIIYNFLGNPFEIENAGESIIMNCYDKTNSESLAQYECDTDTLAEEKNVMFDDPFYARIQFKVGHFMWPKGLWKRDYLCQNIFDEEHVSGRIVIGDDYRPFNSSDIVLIEYLAVKLRPLVKASNDYLSRTPGAFEGMITDLLEKEKSYEARYDRILHHVNWNRYDQYIVLYLVPNSGSSSSPMLLRNMLVHTRELKYPYIGYRSDALLVILNLTNEGISLSKGIAVVQQFLSVCKYSGSYSSVCTDFANLRQYVEQAKDVVQYDLIQEEETLQAYESVIPQLMIRLCRTHYDYDFFLTEGIRKLRAMDREDNTQYLESLLEFTRTNYNLAQTAKNLFIHQSTLKYRLKRISDVTGMDLKSTETRNYLNVLLLIMQEN